MQTLALNKQTHFVFTQHDGNVVSKAYHLQVSQHTHGFVFTTEYKTLGEEVAPSYHILFIDTDQQKLYDYELCHEIPAFEAQLFTMLKQKNAQSCFETILDHGFGVVAESTLSLQRTLSFHGVDNIQYNILNLLNHDAIATLGQLQLKVIPRLYNWLSEAKGEAFAYRQQALLNYPILLVPLLKPIIVETIPAVVSPNETQQSIEKNAFEMGSNETVHSPHLSSRVIDESAGAIATLTNMIDAGHPIETILMQIFNTSEFILASIKQKSYWQITETSHPTVYQQFKDEIEAYGFISQF